MGRPPCGEADERRWQERFDRYRASGLRAGTFCQAEGVSRSTFYRWKKRLNGMNGGSLPPSIKAPAKKAPAVAPVPAESVFVPVSVKSGPIEIELPNGAVVRLSSDISVALLMEVIRAAGALRSSQEPSSC